MSVQSPLLRCAFHDPDDSRTKNDRSYRKHAGEDTSGTAERQGRRAFDKTVSSKPLAFAAGAAAMGIEGAFGTRVRVWGGLDGGPTDPGASQFAMTKLDEGRCHRQFWMG
jgi:hypothetical protein